MFVGSSRINSLPVQASRRQSPCPRARGSRLPQLRSKNHASYPWKDVEVSHQILSQSNRGVRAVAQNNSVTIQLRLPAVVCTSVLLSTIVVAQEAVPIRYAGSLP